MRFSIFSRLLSSGMIMALICFLALTGCKKDEESHPELQTLAATVVSPVKVTLKAKIVTKGSFDIIDHGFIYSGYSSPSEGNGTKVSLGNNAAEGEISKEIQNFSSVIGSTLYYRAYLVNTNGTVYGQVLSVQLPNITTASFVPSTAKVGDQVDLVGQFYDLTKDEVSMTFGGSSAKIISVTPTKITVEVPSGISFNSYYYNTVSIALTIGGQNRSISSNFKLLPTLKNFSPTSGPIGTNITITGDNIVSSYSYNTLKVYFDDYLASSSYGSGSITATVPQSVTEQKLTVSVEIDGNKMVLPGEFTLTAPTVSSLSALSGLPGSVFSIFGTNFSNNSYYAPNGLAVTVGGVPASFSFVSSGQLNVTIPSNLPVGTYKVAVKSGPFTVEATQSLAVQAMSVSSFSPASGSVGKEVTIQGLFVANGYYQVYFGAASTNAYNVTSTSLKANVPYGANPGAVKISVQRDNQTAQSSSDFTILAPSISSFTPANGVSGTAVTISGSGFSPYSYNNTVRFGSTNATVLSATESTIIAVVPSNLNQGAMKISVITNGQTVISSSNFTVN
jgi:hypothetical protein